MAMTQEGNQYLSDQRLTDPDFEGKFWAAMREVIAEDLDKNHPEWLWSKKSGLQNYGIGFVKV